MAEQFISRGFKGRARDTDRGLKERIPPVGYHNYGDPWKSSDTRVIKRHGADSFTRRGPTKKLFTAKSSTVYPRTTLRSASFTL